MTAAATAIPAIASVVRECVFIVRDVLALDAAVCDELEVLVCAVDTAELVGEEGSCPARFSGDDNAAARTS